MNFTRIHAYLRSISNTLEEVGVYSEEVELGQGHKQERKQSETGDESTDEQSVLCTVEHN